ncbi:protein of unknown function [Taphrina deformans PYCC 5710]|uniref:Uncharacterized protein n=1 Tax=Taphrina deformans (strain PYCC 5710 / ATCC 11124 / CBS 356.35 / IMI 108563 / JCM 9778 / NBRC 8474) TaxID=1097556 RepID=R4XFC1_TAPDE|nr:protein of unknown function [Taphrina deformans PYCC 5710]|eukprot:CCG83141.1 protein of unknown function [Taphrina deformans PYCC 5710]
MLTTFLLCNVLIPYGVYHGAARLLHWSDRRVKSPTRHMNEVMAALVLGTTIYFLGGQAESFHPFYAALTSLTTLAHGFVSEFASLQTSLIRLGEWSWQMWTATGTGTTVVLAFAVVHVRFAMMRWGPRVAVGGYLGSFLLLPILLATLTAAVYFLELRTGDGATDDFEMVVGDEERTEMLPREGEEGEDEEEDVEDGESRGGVRTIPPLPIPRAGPVKIKRVLRIHLHHYQIFAYLALFTRFPTIWSRCAAGLALGCMMHGISAYGVDSIFEYEEDRP